MKQPILLLVGFVCFAGLTQAQSSLGKVVLTPGLVAAHNRTTTTARLTESELAFVPFFVRSWQFSFGENPATLTLQRNGHYLLKVGRHKRKGRWKRTGNTAFPVMLLNMEGKTWFLARDESGREEMMLWDGNEQLITALAVQQQ